MSELPDNNPKRKKILDSWTNDEIVLEMPDDPILPPDHCRKRCCGS